MKKITAPSFSEELIEGKIQYKKELRTDNQSFQDQTIEKPLKLQEFYECTFHEITFRADCSKITFVDCIFDHCDFSNCDVQESTLRRVTFQHCRLTGCDLSGSSIQDVTLQECQANYINLNGTHLKNVYFQKNGFVDGSFAQLQATNLQIDTCDFTHSDWLDTNMNGLDFRNSEIDGIMVKTNSLRGMIVNASQAVLLATLLGIEVKDS